MSVTNRRKKKKSGKVGEIFLTTKVEWDVNCPQESKDAIIQSVNDHFEEIFDLVRIDGEPDHRILRGLREVFGN